MTTLFVCHQTLYSRLLIRRKRRHYLTQTWKPALALRCSVTTNKAFSVAPPLPTPPLGSSRANTSVSLLINPLLWRSSSSVGENVSTVMNTYFLYRLARRNFEVYLIMVIDRNFYMVAGIVTHLGCWERTRIVCKSLGSGSWFKKFCSCSPNMPRVLLCQYTDRKCNILLEDFMTFEP